MAAINRNAVAWMIDSLATFHRGFAGQRYEGLQSADIFIRDLALDAMKLPKSPGHGEP
jgi:hypothetical protein